MKLIPNLTKSLLEKYFFSNREKKEVLSVNDPPLDSETIARLVFYYNHLDHSNNHPTPFSSKQTIHKELHLANIFDCPKRYEIIMSILVQQKLCSKDTHIWIDSKKGSKGYLVGLLKILQVQGYYKNNQKLTACQIKEICFSTFGMDVSLSVINHKGIEDYNFDFIPLASSLKIA